MNLVMFSGTDFVGFNWILQITRGSSNEVSHSKKKYSRTLPCMESISNYKTYVYPPTLVKLCQMLNILLKGIIAMSEHNGTVVHVYGRNGGPCVQTN